MGRFMPIYEYQAVYCLQSLFCPKRFSIWQNLSDSRVSECQECRAPLERVMSTFSAGVDVMSHSRAAADPPPGSTAPPPTPKNIYGGGLGIRGCGHDCRTHHASKHSEEVS
jgi:predicted nucleic acid-binding Zn ribbon protein